MRHNKVIYVGKDRLLAYVMLLLGGVIKVGVLDTEGLQVFAAPGDHQTLVVLAQHACPPVRARDQRSNRIGGLSLILQADGWHVGTYLLKTLS